VDLGYLMQGADVVEHAARDDDELAVVRGGDHHAGPLQVDGPHGALAIRPLVVQHHPRGVHHEEPPLPPPEIARPHVAVPGRGHACVTV